MGDALEACAVDQQQFTAPASAVYSGLSTVKRQSVGGGGQAVLGEDGGDVRVMVLDGKHRDVVLTCHAFDHGRRIAVAEQVVSQQGRRDFQHLQEMRDGFLESGKGGRVGELADILGNERFVATGDAYGVLDRPAHGQYRWSDVRQLDGARGIAARTADDLQTTGPGARDAVVTAGDDFAVVHDEGVGQAGEPRQGFLVVDADRFAVAVAAAHQQREILRLFEPFDARGASGGFVKQQVVDRRDRQHDTQPGKTRGDTRQLLVTVRALFQQDDRPFRQIQQPRLADAELDIGNGRGCCRKHDREGTILMPLVFAHARHGGRVARIAGQMKTARPLDGDDFSVLQQAQCLSNHITSQQFAGGIEQGKLRAAFRAAIAFGMQSPVIGPDVFGMTFAAHGKGFQAGALAVEGQAGTDRVTRSAMAAVAEGVTPAPPFRVEHLAQAVAADHGVLGNHRRGTAPAAVKNEEIPRDGYRVGVTRGQGVDAGQRRGILMQAPNEVRHLSLGAANLDFDTA